MKIRSPLSWALVACWPAGAVLAQTAAPAASPPSPGVTAPTTAGAAPVDASPSLLDSLKLPDLRKMNLPLPRSVQAANALLGLATQRLALVVGTGNVGPQIQLPSVSRDTQAVAAALRAAGFVVMVREDLNAEDLRAALDEFRGRLQPGGTGFLYFAGLGAQVGGENVVLTRGLQVTGTGPNTRIKGTAVPLQEIVEAVQGTPESPRYLVVDAAFSHPTLANLSSQGLAAQKVPPGVMALFSQSPGVAAEAPEPFVLPLPTPTDPRLTAGSTFGRELVRSLVTPKLNGSEILRVTRGAMLDVTAGKQAPVIVGESASQDEFAEPNLLDTLFPRTPEDMAREALKQALRTGSNAGEIPVSQVGNAAPVSTPATPPATGTTPAPAAAAPGDNVATDSKPNSPTAQRNALESATRRLADGPSPTSLLSTAVGATAAVGSAAAGVAGTAAVASTMAAATQAGAMATAMGVASSVASSAVGVLGSVASLVSGGGSSSGGGAAAAVAAKEASRLVRPASAAGALSQAGGDARNQAASAAAAAVPSAAGGASPAPAATLSAAPTVAAAAPSTAAANAAVTAPAATPVAATPAAQATAPVTAMNGAAAPAGTSTPTAGAPNAAGSGPAAEAAAGAPNPPNGAAAMGARNAQALSANGTAGEGVASSAASAGQELPVSAVNAPATPVAAATAAAPAAAATMPGAVPRAGVPEGLTAEQWPGAAQPPGPQQPRTAKQQSGGERPAYVPKVNPFGYAEGDTFMFRTMDTWKDQHLGNTVHTVEEVLPNGDLLTDGHQSVMDAEGRFKRLRQLDGTVSEFAPAQELWWSNPVRGQSRDIRFKETFRRADQSRGETEWKGSASVGRLRKISTQAGEFEAFPIESSGWYYEQVGRGPLNSGQWSRTVWYSPKLGHPVAIDIEDANALGKLLRRERVELLQVQSAKSLAASAP